MKHNTLLEAQLSAFPDSIVFEACVQDDERSHEATAIARGRFQMNTKWEKLERIVFLVGMIVIMLDLFYWRP